MSKLLVAGYKEAISSTYDKVAKKIKIHEDMVVEKITGYFTGTGTDTAIFLNIKVNGKELLAEEMPLRAIVGSNNEGGNLPQSFTLEKTTQPEVIISTAVSGTLYLAFWGRPKN